jgi:uncharacterized coiled-coil protein SlyX
MNKTLLAEKQLKQEIEELKTQIQEQNNSFKGHQEQMALLQQKLNELQQLQRRAAAVEPPPAYAPTSRNKSASEKDKPQRTLKNPFMPNAKTRGGNAISRSCTTI